MMRKMGRKLEKKDPTLSIAPVGTASFLGFAPLDGLLISGRNPKKYSGRRVVTLKKALCLQLQIILRSQI